MFGFHSSAGYNEVLDGIKIKTLNYGENMLTTEVLLEKGSLLPEHSHPNEQSGYLVKGSIKLYINGIAKIMKPGDSWSIDANINHKAEVLEDSVALEVFSPLREDYMKHVYEKDIIK